MTTPPNFIDTFFHRIMRNLKISLRLHLTFAISLIVIVSVVLITYVNFYYYQRYLVQATQDIFLQASKNVINKMQQIFTPARSIIEIIDEGKELTQNKTPEEVGDYLYTVSTITSRYSTQISAVFIGYDDGSFISIDRTPPIKSEQLADIPKTIKPETFKLIVDRHNPNKQEIRWYYRYQGKWIRGFDRISPLEKYDPRKRPWYKKALEKKNFVWTDIYEFALPSNMLGITAAKQTPLVNNKSGVLGVDIELNDIVDYLKKLQFSDNSYAFILDAQNRNLISHPELKRYFELKKPSLDFIHFQNQSDLLLKNELKAFNTVEHLINKNEQDRPYLGFKTKLNESLGLDAILYLGAPVDDFTKVALQIVELNFKLTIFICILMVLIGFFTSRYITNPIQKIVKNLEEIRSINFGKIEEVRKINSPIIEIDNLSAATELMHNSLESFQRFVPIELIRQLVELNKPLIPGGDRLEITILFTDIANFTTIAESSSEDVLVSHLSEYFSQITQIIKKHGGIVDKFIGDAVMAIWGAPAADPAHTRHACLAIRECYDAINALNQRWEAEGKPAYLTRFGVHRGLAFVGNLGTEERMNYTALGDVVNIAARLESLNKTYQSQILVSQEVVMAAGTGFDFIKKGQVTVKGKTKEVTVYEMRV